MTCPILFESVNGEINRTVKKKIKIVKLKVLGRMDSRMSGLCDWHGCHTEPRERVGRVITFAEEAGEAPFLNLLAFVLKFAPNYCD